MSDPKRPPPQPPALPKSPKASVPPPLPAPAAKPAEGPSGQSGHRRSGIPSSLLMVTPRQKTDIAHAALKLRDEQVSARIIYFEPDQKTNAELDKITESVIAELRAIQLVRGPNSSAPASADDREAELRDALRARLEQLLDPKRATFLRARLDTISRRITNLFFEAALGHHATPENLAARVVALPEQALYYAVARSKAQIVEDMQSLNYESEEVYNESLDRLARLEKELQVSLLARKAPELEKLLPVVIEVFTNFLSERFRLDLGEFTTAVVHEALMVRGGGDGGPRIEARAFKRFREVFERHFLERLVNGVQEPLVQRLDAMETGQHVFHTETLDFVADPRVFSVVCGVVCDGFYDHLHSDGLLELPPQWRNAP